MRLYRLLSRVGKRKRRAYPWFDAPEPEAPMKYDGWVWKPEIKEWVEVPVEKITLEIPSFYEPKPEIGPSEPMPDRVVGWIWSYTFKKWLETPYRAGQYVEEKWPRKPLEPPVSLEYPYVAGWYWSVRSLKWEKDHSYVPPLRWVPGPRPPMPDRAPGAGFPEETKDWVWNYEVKDWMPIIRPTQVVEFEPPRSFPPNVTYASVNMVYPMTEQYALFQQNLISQGLTSTEAKRIGEMMVDGFWNMSRSSLTKARAAAYAESFTPAAVALSDKIQVAGVYGAIFIITAAVGYVIGSVLERLITPEEDYYILQEPDGTYLLGPDNWSYSRDIGSSKTGALLFSRCKGIGTEFVRHKRGYEGDLYDTIDFPGGFVEEGYQFPYWVKYTWYYWSIIYIGMLYTASAEHYALKKELISLKERAIRVKIRPYEEWCEGFHWYL